VPNGHEEERNAVWSRSRFWGVVWDLADAAYYIGLLGSVGLPLFVLFGGPKRFEPAQGWLLWRLGVAAGLLLVSFPAGFTTRWAGQALAEWAVGVRHEK